MKGRFFNQYSYITLDRYSSADYVVTIDSDCAFFTPVVPEVLFNAEGDVILPTSTTFQVKGWNKAQSFFTNTSLLPNYGHAMITQPVNFRVDSFKKSFETGLKQK